MMKGKTVVGAKVECNKMGKRKELVRGMGKN